LDPKSCKKNEKNKDLNFIVFDFFTVFETKLNMDLLYKESLYGKSIQSTENEIGLIIRRHPYGHGVFQ